MKHMTLRLILFISLVSFQVTAAEPSVHSPSLSFPALHKPSLHNGVHQRWPEEPQADINLQRWDAEHLEAARQTQQHADMQSHQFDSRK